ncbi:MAG: hypothetical protein HND52_16895 [Ignavibacteriae bacterium]|jgi:hypothetical protein|nr:hypothetical protein [Ignavibacteriota bacterium]NOG99638.1 hypothetical protein [Ignavibacteriota bacterium]
MKSLIKIIVFLCLLCSFNYAQKQTSEELLLAQIEALNQLNTQLNEDYNSISIINQIGVQNSGIIEQTNAANIQPGNAAIINQAGFQNNASVNQNGNDIITEVLQVGDGNNYEGSADGIDISTVVHQFGIDNNVEQELTGTNLDYGIFQFGISNEVLQIENGTGQLGPSYKVTQFGNGLKISITNGTIK